MVSAKTAGTARAMITIIRRGSTRREFIAIPNTTRTVRRLLQEDEEEKVSNVPKHRSLF